MAKIKDYICYNTPGANFVAQVPDRFKKQAEAEVVPSSSLVKIRLS